MIRLIAFLLVLAVGVAFAFYIIKPEEKHILPVINPIDITEEGVVDPELLRVGQGHKIAEFEFTDQNGKTFNSSKTDGKIYVAEYFFTTCQSICPIMNKQLQRVQKAFTRDTNVLILSFTVDPDTDDVKKMKSYAKWKKADDSQWYFLTGKKEDLYSLARKSFFTLKQSEVKNQGDAGGDFIHTNNFVLVDREKRIRGYYDGTSTKEVDHLIQDIKLLKEE